MRSVLVLLLLTGTAIAKPSMSAKVLRDIPDYEDYSVQWSASICVSQRRVYELEQQIKPYAQSGDFNAVYGLRYTQQKHEHNITQLKRMIRTRGFTQYGCRDKVVETYVCENRLIICSYNTSEDVVTGHPYSFYSPIYDTDDEEERQQYIPQHPSTTTNPPCVDDICVEITIQQQ